LGLLICDDGVCWRVRSAADLRRVGEFWVHQGLWAGSAAWRWPWVWGWSSAMRERPGPPRLIRLIRRPRQRARNRPPSPPRRRRSPADPRRAAVRRDQRRPLRSLRRFPCPQQPPLAAVTVRSSSRRRDRPHHRAETLGVTARTLGVTARPASGCRRRRLQSCSLRPANASSCPGTQELTPSPNRRLLLRGRLRLVR
jgi:hypothetical protein